MAHLRQKPVVISTLLSTLACLPLTACGGNSASSPTVTLPPATPTIPPASATPTPSTAGTTPLTADPAIVRSRGYTPSPHNVQTPDGFGHTLYAWHGTCAGSADGYCQMMFFFIDTRFLGTDTKDPSTAIAEYRAAGTGTIAVTYASYGSQDPLCCPSGKPVTITYHWNGSRLIPSGIPPDH
jgi:hypothetical protein